MKSISTLVFVLAFFFSLISSAETIVCKGDNVYLSLKASLDKATTPPSLKAQLKTKAMKKAKDLTLKIAPRGDTLNYTDFFESKDFWLSMGKFKGEGLYSKVNLTTRTAYQPLNSSAFKYEEKKYELKCNLTGYVAFKNYCEQTSNNSPQDNLITAVETKNSDLLFATLPCEIDVNVETKSGCTPLLTLLDKNCGTGKFDEFQSLNINGMVLGLLDAGALTNSVDPLTQETALIKAVRAQDLTSTKDLIDAESDIDAQDKDGFTALMRAASAPDNEMVEMLVASGADLDMKNSEGKTALQIAKANDFKNHYEVLSGLNTIIVQGDKSGVCTPMEFSLKLNQPNRIILKTENSMLMLDSKDLNISMMVSSGSDGKTTVTPTKAGQFKMTCGPSMGDGNAVGKITVE